MILFGGCELLTFSRVDDSHASRVFSFLFRSLPVLGWNKGRGIAVALKCSKYKHPGDLHPGIDYSMW